MAYKGILGHDRVTPVMTPDGTKPVLMESPCPFTQFEQYHAWEDFRFALTSGGDTTKFGSHWWKWTSLRWDYNRWLYIGIQCKMLSTGTGRSVTATLECGGGEFNRAYVFIRPLLAGSWITGEQYEPDGWLEYELSLDAPSVQIPEIYYRYGFEIALDADSKQPAEGAWVKVTLDTSV